MAVEEERQKTTTSFVCLNLAGEVLIVFAFLILFFTYGPAAKEEVGYQLRQHPAFSLSAPSQKEPTPPNTSFSIVIPKLDVAAPVFADVNPFDPNEFLPILKKGVAHAKGSALPGHFGNTYIFAHSTDAFYNVGQYNAVFYLLGKLTDGDEIYIYYNNQNILIKWLTKSG